MEFISNLIGGAVSGLAGIKQAKINAKIARENTDKTILANKELAEYSYSKDLESWNRQNEYNSPESQMKRYTDAGLNPNLMYGQGTTGNASTLPQYNAPTAEYNYKPQTDYLGIINAFQDMRMKQAQTDNVRQNTNRQITENAMRAIDLNYYDNNAEINWQKNVRQNDALRINNRTASIKENILRSTEKSQIQMYQEESRGMMLENLIKSMEYNFLKSGGKYFNPIIQGLNAFKK